MSFVTTKSSVAIHYPHASKPGLKLVSKRYNLAHKRSSAGLTLIFAHCTGAHKELWEPVIENLLQREDNTSLAVREAWSIDWQSHGEAAELNEHVLGTDADGLSVQEWATGIQGLINSKLLAGHRLVCIGHSAGATAMLLAVAALPQADTRIKGIVLLEPSLITRDEFHKHLRERTAALDFMQKAVAGRRAEWNTREDAMQYFKKRMPWKIWDPRVLNLFVTYGLRDVPAKDQECTRKVTLRCTNLQEQKAFLETEPHFRAVEILTTLTIPVHCILGDREDIVPKYSHDSILNVHNMASVQRVPQAGHFALQENPDGVATCIGNVLNALDAPQSRL